MLTEQLAEHARWLADSHTGCRFHGKNGDFRHADFRQADLRGADFFGADLRGADLRGADVRWADFRIASLAGADLRGIRCFGTNFAAAVIDKEMLAETRNVD